MSILFISDHFGRLESAKVNMRGKTIRAEKTWPVFGLLLCSRVLRNCAMRKAHRVKRKEEKRIEEADEAGTQ